jgi:PBP1b-binding outer membrane lipoprotein LpoB
MRKLTSYLAIIAIAFVTVSCQGFFGEKTDLSIIDAPEFQARNVAYVPIQPIISGFVAPTDVVIGFDELIYVVDSGTRNYCL